MSWDPAFHARSPIFEPLREPARALGAVWPRRRELQCLLDARRPTPSSHGGNPLRLVAPLARRRAFEERYEGRVYLRGELEVREECWHDLLNVLVWLTFPRAKAALNARHYRELVAREGPGNRGPVEDALTLFDEGGVIAATSDVGLAAMLRSFEWKTLFWANRDRVLAHMRFLVFGHALYEKALAPFTGITARAIVLHVEEPVLRSPLADLTRALDVRAASQIADPVRLSATRDLAPMPILGVPGWCAANEREAYYDDVAYFRRGRAAAPVRA